MNAPLPASRRASRHHPPLLPLPPDSQYIRSMRNHPRPTDAPTIDLARSIAGRVEIHLINNNWEAAQLALDSGLRDHAAELSARAARRRRSRDQWLVSPIADLELPLRDHNTLEDQGCYTVEQAIAEVNSNHGIEGFSVVAIARFWRAVSAAGLGDLREFNEEETLKQIELEKKRKASMKRSNAKASERIAAGGLGGRKAFTKPERVFRSAGETG